MRILHLVHQYVPECAGGTEIYTQTLAAAQARRGCQVAVFYRSTADRAAVRPAIAEPGAVVDWPAGGTALTPTRRFLATFDDRPITQAFAAALDAWQPDLVHVQHLLGLPVSLLDAIRQRGIPFVVTLHDYWWVCANAQLLTNYSAQICSGPALYANCARCALARVNVGYAWPAVPGLAALLARRGRLLRQALGHAERLIAPTRFVKDWYVSHGVPGERIDVVPHGIGAPAPPASGRQLDGTVRFAAIGGLAWQKGIHVLLEAFRGVQGYAELWVAGDECFDPAYSDRLHAMAGPGVRFLGRLSHAGVWETLSQVDVLVVPSLWYETFSMIAHEAFAARVPVIASRLGALAEAVHDGVDGLLVPPGDVAAWRAAMQRLVDDPAYRARLSAGTQPPLTVAEHMGRIEAIYQAVQGKT